MNIVSRVIEWAVMVVAVVLFITGGPKDDSEWERKNAAEKAKHYAPIKRKLAEERYAQAKARDDYATAPGADGITPAAHEAIDELLRDKS